MYVHAAVLVSIAAIGMSGVNNFGFKTAIFAVLMFSCSCFAQSHAPIPPLSRGSRKVRDGFQLNLIFPLIPSLRFTFAAVKSSITLLLAMN
jgi:hypothetical protein